MTRYFLHVHNGNGLQADDVGHDFGSGASAVAQAAVTAGEIISDETADALLDRAVRIVVEDDAHAEIAQVEMRVRVSSSNKS